MSAAADFREAMAAVGVDARDPWDLVNTARSYRTAIPVLLRWLEERDDGWRFREGIVRSLAVREARGVAGPVLVREFRRPDLPFDYRWAVGNSLEMVADDAIAGDLVEIARDRSFGAGRQMVVMALGKVRDPRAAEVLTELLDDTDVALHARKALSKLRH